MHETVFLNGSYISADQASVSPNDRGFIFGDGVYEVIKYYYGKPFCLEEHLTRLKRSLHEVGIHYPGIAELTGIFDELLIRNQLSGTHAGVYLQITRGVFPRVHHFPANIAPSVYAFAYAMPSFRENLEKGIKVITAEDIRWLRCDIKSIALLPNTMLYDQAVKNGAGECLLIRNGVVTEATHSSVFGVKDGTVFTHPLTNLILPGITRQVVLELCSRHQIPFKEEAIPEKELTGMDELFITGTGSEVTPVVQVNEKITGNHKPGELTRFIQTEFFKMTR